MNKFSKNFCEFEFAVMKKLLNGNESFLTILRKQYEGSKVERRECSGHGFYTYFSVSSAAPKLDVKNLHFGDVTAVIDGVSEGVGFVLFIKDGKIDCLEGYTYGETFPLDVKKYVLSYVDGEKRDFEKLRKSFCR